MAVSTPRVTAMKASALSVGWYWLRATFRKRLASYVTIVVLVGSIGGLAIGSLSAAQRTQSSFNVFLASTNPSDLTVTLYAPNIRSEERRVRHVRHVGESSYSLNAFPAGRNGAPDFAPALLNGNVTSTGSVKDEYFSEDKVAVV